MRVGYCNDFNDIANRIVAVESISKWYISGLQLMMRFFNFGCISIYMMLINEIRVFQLD